MFIEDDSKYWVWLSSIKGIGTHTQHLLLEGKLEPKDIYECICHTPEKLREYCYVSENVFSKIIANSDEAMVKAEKIIEDCKKKEN